MKKGMEYEGEVLRVAFPNKGIVRVDDLEAEETAVVKGVLPGQRILFRVQKKRGGRAEGRLLSVLRKAPNEIDVPDCPHFSRCGGCTYRNLSYEDQFALKEQQVKDLLQPVLPEGALERVFLPGKHSPLIEGYRNKMEFTFGDEVKDGALCLGMHARGSMYDVVTTDRCKLVHADFCRILQATLSFFAERKIPYYHRMQHTGILRHLLVRRGEHTGEILADLVTTSEMTSETLRAYADMLCGLDLAGEIVGILHTINNAVADTITNEGTEILYGRDHFTEEILGLQFKITPFSFFQTNSKGAEVLYETAREFVEKSLPGGLKDLQGKVVFDLYSGTGTITQIFAPVCDKAVGVEIVEEAVEAAKENARANGLTNCEFIAGDVLQVMDGLEDRPEYIILDPPRDGIHPKAMPKILSYGVKHIVYISCKPTSLARDLVTMQAAGYEVKQVCCVDMFPFSGNVECCVLLSRVSNRKADSYVKLNVKMEDYYRIKDSEHE